MTAEERAARIADAWNYTEHRPGPRAQLIADIAAAIREAEEVVREALVREIRGRPLYSPPDAARPFVIVDGNKFWLEEGRVVPAGEPPTAGEMRAAAAALWRMKEAVCRARLESLTWGMR